MEVKLKFQLSIFFLGRGGGICPGPQILNANTGAQILNVNDLNIVRKKILLCVIYVIM